MKMDTLLNLQDDIKIETKNNSEDMHICIKLLYLY